MKVLFVCSGNMMRSQIAEAFYNSLTDTHDATSAGTEAVGIDSASRRAIAVMDEAGISLAGHTSKQLTPEIVGAADKVFVFEGFDLPEYLLNSNFERWNISDLGYGQKNSLSADRAVRDYIRARVQKLVKESHD